MKILVTGGCGFVGTLLSNVMAHVKDMQKYGLIGSMARVDEILGILEEASRILKEDGYGTLVFERLVFQ